MPDVTSSGKRVIQGSQSLNVAKKNLEIRNMENQVLRYEIEVAEMKGQIESREESILATQARIKEERTVLAKMKAALEEPTDG
jgi:predicted  nucleic acid-binding Zn-ribbon protein